MRPTYPTIVLTFSLFIAFVLAPAALAQSASHPVSVSVPSYLGIRIVGAGTGAPRSVVFDYGSDALAYVEAGDTGGRLEPTDVTSFDDVEVNVVGWGDFWYLFVEATSLEYSGPGSGAGLDLADIRVARGSASGLTQDAFFLGWGGILARYDGTWTLSTTPRWIARSWIGTGGWSSLGFNGWDYTLGVDGGEDAGTYTTTVTYFLTLP